MDHLQTNENKNWFLKRFQSSTHKHYNQTSAQVQTENYIEEMFKTLDQDGSNTLDMGEITDLFKENGIHMSIE